MLSYCRICCRDDLDSSLPLHHRSEISCKSILHMMAYVTGLKIKRGDNLPQQICRICFGQLLISYELKRTSIESLSHFRKLLSIPPAMRAEKELLDPPVSDVKLEVDDEQETLDSGNVTTKEEGIMQNDSDHIEIMYYCCWSGACQESFESKDLLIAHVDLHHRQAKELNEVVRANDDFVCNVCALGFNDAEELLLHSLQMKQKVFKCEVCYFRTWNQAEYNMHSKSHETLFQCVCGYATNRKFSLQRHLASLRCEEIYGKKASFVPARQEVWTPVKQRKMETPEQSKTCDTTNSELVKMGFSVVHTREPGKFYCCFQRCQEKQDSELQCVEHYETTHKAELQLTEEESSGKEGPTCKICRRVFRDAKDLKIHREDSFLPSFQCSTCGKDGFTKKTALAHSDKACAVNRFTCPCGFLTNELSLLTTHFNSGTCSRGLDLLDGARDNDTIEELSVSNLEQEEASNVSAMEQDGNEGRYICKHCGVSRKNKISFLNHQRLEKMRTLRQQLLFDSGREMDGIPGKMYNCKWCNEPTNNLAHLIQCMVNVKKNLRCKKCHLKFFSKRRLEFHNIRGCRAGKQMVKQRNYNCLYCERRFTHPSILERHVTVDHREDCGKQGWDPTRKYLCTVCGFRFRRKFSLTRHMTVHREKSGEVRKEQPTAGS